MARNLRADLLTLRQIASPPYASRTQFSARAEICNRLQESGRSGHAGSKSKVAEDKKNVSGRSAQATGEIDVSLRHKPCARNGRLVVCLTSAMRTKPLIETPKTPLK